MRVPHHPRHSNGASTGETTEKAIYTVAHYAGPEHSDTGRRAYKQRERTEEMRNNFRNTHVKVRVRVTAAHLRARRVGVRPCPDLVSGVRDSSRRTKLSDKQRTRADCSLRTMSERAAGSGKPSRGPRHLSESASSENVFGGLIPEHTQRPDPVPEREGARTGGGAFRGIRVTGESAEPRGASGPGRTYLCRDV